MDIITTSLDALLQRATNPLNQNVDKAAVEAFCGLVNKEKDGYHIGVKLIALRLHSKQEKEVLQTLNILDTCMQRCGSNFQSEVGKFRFLNEMIKLVSPKYLGSQTPLSVRQKVLQLMCLWTLDYPKESKIKEAYDMLKKQGIIMETPLSINSDSYQAVDKMKSSIFCDEEKSKLLQKLLQSKNPEDLQAANRLIKCMVKEDDKRAELKSRKILELESVHSNVRLLSEMLDTYVKDGSSHDEMELIKELHQSCERLRPTVLKLASETQQNEDILRDILNASDELGKVFDKYKEVIINGKRHRNVEKEENLSLLDFGSSKPGTPTLLDEAKVTACNNNNMSEFDVLCDIFTTPNGESLLEVENTILQPVSLLRIDKTESPKQNGKLKALEELDVLGESLLKKNLQSITKQGPKFQKNVEKIPMNKLTTIQNEIKQQSFNATPILSSENIIPVTTLSSAMNLDLSYLLGKTKIDDESKVTNILDSNDDLLVDITEEKSDISEKPDLPKKDCIVTDIIGECCPQETLQQNSTMKAKLEVKLSDLYVDLDSIKPSNVLPVVALEEKNGISVTLHFARDKPRDDVTVVVVTIVSKNELALKNILFRAVVPKSCKVKLQPPSATELPPFNPFLPPSAITQIMLISNPEKVNVSLKFIVSYNVEDETTTEIGEIDCLPTVS
ncbi:Gga [Trypoxylus dichotomus]